MEFINGIELLDEVMTYTDVWKYNGLCIVLTCLVGLIILVGIIGAIVERDAEIFGFSCFALLLLLLLLPVGITTVENGYEYKVIVSDEVNMNEFTKQYDLVRQEGKIYVIKPKDES